MSTEQQKNDLFQHAPPDLGITVWRTLLQLLADQERVVISYTLTTDDGEELHFSTEDPIDHSDPRAKNTIQSNSRRRVNVERSTHEQTKKEN